MAALDNIKYKLETHKTLVYVLTGILLAIMIIMLNNKYYVPYFFPNLNELKDDNTYILTNTQNKQDLLLVKGMLPFNNNEIVFNTSNKKSQKYVKMSKSTNNSNGAELTYSFWVNKKSSQSSNYKDRIILLKGLKSSNVTVKAPLIKFGNNSEELVIQFNTSKGDEEAVIDTNSFNITGGDRWYLVTVVLQDFKNPDDNFEEGINVLIYLNGSLINSGTVIKNKSLKLNDAPLYILPNVDGTNFNALGGNLCDMKYHNYALSQIEINQLYHTELNEIPFKTALDLKMSSGSGSSQHKFDLNLLNETEQI